MGRVAELVWYIPAGGGLVTQNGPTEREGGPILR